MVKLRGYFQKHKKNFDFTYLYCISQHIFVTKKQNKKNSNSEADVQTEHRVQRNRVVTYG